MELTVQFSPPAQVAGDWLVAAAWEDAAGTDVPGLDRLRQRGDITGKPNELTTLLEPAGLAADRLLVVGLGKREPSDRARLHDAAAAAARAVTGKERGRVAFVLPADVPGLAPEHAALAVGTGFMHGCQGPGLHKGKPERFAPRELCLVAPPGTPEEEVRRGAHRAAVEGRAVWLARELVNSPPSDLYPETFADRACQVTSEVGVSCEIFDEERLERERMGALLGVARGSDRPPRLAVLRYLGRPDEHTLGLIGKGVTFDSGGLSLKTSEQMVDMKCDMAGAAAVLAAVRAVAELKLPVNLLGVLALVENLPSGKALKLGDVLRTRTGKTIEVLNTDAEGRLILADALAYAVDQKVSHLVDLATLTGACMVALGTEVAGLMGNDDAWCEQVLAAARRAGERAWRLPMWPIYDDMIKSHVADMRNTGGSRYGGAITAAKLLEQFVGKVPWVHLDIAGPAWAEHENAVRDAGGTGCFVHTLVELAAGY